MSPVERQVRACQMLFAAIVAAAMVEDDDTFVCGPIFSAYAQLAGMSSEAVFQTRIRFLRGEISPARLNLKAMSKDRFGYYDKRTNEEAHWDQWGSRSASA